MLIVLTISSYSQDLFIGINKYGINTKESSSVGFIIGGSYEHFYVDLSSNLVTGIGRKIDFYFKSEVTIKTNKTNVTLINVGYDFVKKRKYHIIPTIGFGYHRIIWQGPIEDIKLDSYYITDKINPYINFGLSTKYFFKDFGVLMGFGLKEQFKFCLIYKF